MEGLHLGPSFHGENGNVKESEEPLKTVKGNRSVSNFEFV